MPDDGVQHHPAVTQKQTNNINNNYDDNNKNDKINNNRNNNIYMLHMDYCNGLEEYGYYNNSERCKSSEVSQVRIKFDTGASMNMSGVENRIEVDRDISNRLNVNINGFNGKSSKAESIGKNGDNKFEYFVPDMPNDLVLLCGHDYASDGAAVLHKDGGVIIRLDESEFDMLMKFVKQYPVLKELKVNNRTYEVVSRDENEFACCSEVSTQYEEAYSNTSTRFFNTKTYISNNEERVLTLLLTGLSFKDWMSVVKNDSLGGIPPDVNMQMLNRFENKYGRTPDIIRMAIPHKYGNRKGLMYVPPPLTDIGERVEIDIYESDYNDPKTNSKLASHGGALAAAVCVDCFSGFVMLQLIASKANTRKFVNHFINEYNLHDKQIQLIASDSGIVSQGVFQVLTPELEEYLHRHGIKTQRAEPHNHSKGGATVERHIGMIKSLIRLAVNYVLANPNFNSFGFSKLQILKLWGELSYWAATIINLKPSPHDKSKTRYEVFYGVKPNMQNIRILPIFSFVMIPTYHTQKDAMSRQLKNVPALYIGPSMSTGMVGCIKAATSTESKKKVMVLHTSVFTPATDGGGVNVHAHVQSGTVKLLSGENLAERQEKKDNVESKDVTIVIEEHTLDDDHFPQKRNDVVVIPTGLEKIDKVVEEQGVQQQHPSTTIVSNTILPDNNNLSIISSEVKDRQISQLSPGASVNTMQPPIEVQKVIANNEEGVGLKKVFKSQIPLEDTPPSRFSKRLKEKNSVKFKSDEEVSFVDWSEHIHEPEQFYYSFEQNKFYVIEDEIGYGQEGIEYAHWSEVDGKYDDDEKITVEEEGFKAVKTNVPKSFMAALNDRLWGDAARKEFDTLFQTKAIVQVEADIAKSAIASGTADLVILFPVYEEKMRDGERVFKVRLVCNGQTQYNHGNTYSATPSREELLILIHIIAVYDWDYAHVDESRAFLNSDKRPGGDVFTKFRGSKEYFQILGALYGLKTSPKDYQDHVARRFMLWGYKRLKMCSCIYVYISDNDRIVIVFAFVDDFIFTGNDPKLVEEKLVEFRASVVTTEPLWNAEEILGIEVKRRREESIMCCTMTKKISELAAKFELQNDQGRNVPIPVNGYIVDDRVWETSKGQVVGDDDNEFSGKLVNEKNRYSKRVKSNSDEQYLDKNGIATYMSIVGGLVWISGIRLDITFAVLYLSWFTKQPRQHHMNMALHVTKYLYNTKDLPLVLGGHEEVQLIGYTDASYATAPKCRSISGHLIRLGNQAGAIVAKAKASTSVVLSSFEAELDGTANAIKSIARIDNILTELGMRTSSQPMLWGDNKAMIEFVNGKGVAKGVRHMELRKYYIREKILKGDVTMDHMSGEVLTADKLTKLSDRGNHWKFAKDIMGLGLLPETEIYGFMPS